MHFMMSKDPTANAPLTLSCGASGRSIVRAPAVQDLSDIEEEEYAVDDPGIAKESLKIGARVPKLMRLQSKREATINVLQAMVKAMDRRTSVLEGKTNPEKSQL